MTVDCLVSMPLSVQKGKVAQEEVVKGLGKGTWEERLKEVSLTKRNVRGWLTGFSCLRE